MSPRKSAAALTLGSRRAEPPDRPVGGLVWQHTELGRCTVDGAFRIVRHGDGWVLLDAEWTRLAICRDVPEAQHVAAGIARAKDRRNR